jgi:P4 family phage/plasmid primase-like protien
MMRPGIRGERPGDPADEEQESPADSDDFLARRFAEAFEGQLRYVADLGAWFEWTGTHWREERTLRALDLARRICRAHAGERGRRELASAARVHAVVDLARSDRRLAGRADEWDTDPWLLNTPEGVVDLRTGQVGRHRAGQFMTKITNASPSAGAPMWLQYLARVTDGDKELQAYLQRIAGYCLTGSTREHALFFLYGPGANGKSIFINTLLEALGSYATVADPAAFLTSKWDRHPAEIAVLQGARLVTAQENEAGRPWAESRIKTLTAGDPITARRMRQDPYTFTPVAKLCFAGNSRPTILSVDEAMRRRVNLIPFTQIIPPDERDQHLADKLKGELGGILSWALEGCLAWQRVGLNPPAVVTDATANYLAGQDTLGAWIEARCILEPLAWSPVAKLFESWVSYTGTVSEQPGSMKAFSQRLADRGFIRKHRESGSSFLGINLRGTAEGC